MKKNGSMIISSTETYVETDAEGNVTTKTTEKTSRIQRNGEPDYIKLYTKMWCQYNLIPEKWHRLFFELAVRMNYVKASDLEGSQTVIVYGPVTESIVAACGWKDKSTLRKGLKALCDCKAIRSVGRATYQINPHYASRGEWLYNPNLDRGGVKDLIAVFDFAKGTVDTQITWAAGDSAPDAKLLGLKEGEAITAKTTRVKAKPQEQEEDPFEYYGEELFELPGGGCQ